MVKILTITSWLLFRFKVTSYFIWHIYSCQQYSSNHLKVLRNFIFIFIFFFCMESLLPLIEKQKHKKGKKGRKTKSKNSKLCLWMLSIIEGFPTTLAYVTFFG